MLAVDFTTVDYLLAALAAFAAGVVNAVAGGGTLISFPALMALGAIERQREHHQHGGAVPRIPGWDVRTTRIAGR